MKYLLRNQSVVVREFQGQLKSTLVCPHCNGLSKIFDPFMFLSLPLPIKKTRTIYVSVVKAEPGQPIVKVGGERERDRKKAIQLLQHCYFEQGLGNVECFLLLAWEFPACVHL